jgi:hypothetical protein
MEEQKVVKTNRGVLIYIILGIIGIILIYILTTNVIPKAMITLTKAAPSTIVSLDASYLLGGKLLAAADGKDSAIVNVFVLDKDGKPVSGKNVSLNGVTTYSPKQIITDLQGKAVFSITSLEEKQYVVEGVIDTVPMGKKVSVTFRN